MVAVADSSVGEADSGSSVGSKLLDGATPLPVTASQVSTVTACRTILTPTPPRWLMVVVLVGLIHGF